MEPRSADLPIAAATPGINSNILCGSQARDSEDPGLRGHVGSHEAIILKTGWYLIGKFPCLGPASESYHFHLFLFSVTCNRII